jgi:hypothetical protein
MVCPITSAESYVGESGKSMKGVQGWEHLNRLVVEISDLIH